MNIEELRDCCLAVKGAEECTSLGEDLLSYKIMNKVFAFYLLNSKEGEHFVVLKCDPDKTVELREKYQGVTKGVYTGATLMWNSVYIQKDVPDALIAELIEHSAEEVVKKLPKKKQEEYKALNVRSC
ncbi:MmcQ/YjbR family DNA-binding protein [Bacteroides reticulotermitis]|uniref:MmcQ/YjbR family DNA-binding protein n=1 Tax=Bacteroides reticulotermitis TaxID=1133319 RepID=UPI003A842916